MLRRLLLPLLIASLAALVWSPSAMAGDTIVTTDGTRLVRFDSNNPSTVIRSTTITGLVGGDTIIGLDIRPGTGQLYGLGSGSRLYTLNVTTGAATQVGSDGAFTLNGAVFGFDFNPVPDRIRITSNADQNLRINPNDATLTATDGTLAYAVGDPNVGANPNITGSGYTNSFAGSTSTTLYGIDTGLDTLVTQSPPNNGALNTVAGGLGVNATDATLNILALNGGGNRAYAILTVGGQPGFYTINLATGAATQVGATPIGGASPVTGAHGFVIYPTPSDQVQLSTATSTVAESAGTAAITVTRTNELADASVMISTSNGSASAGSDYTAFSQNLTFTAGQTSKVVNVPITDDTAVEGDESFLVSLSAATGNYGAPSSATVTITDNDTAPVVVPPPVVVIPDTTRPQLLTSYSYFASLKLRAAGLPIRASSNEPTKFTATLKAVGSTRVLGTATAQTTSTNSITTIKLQPNLYARQLLKKKKALRVTIVVTGVDAAGNKTTVPARKLLLLR